MQPSSYGLLQQHMSPLSDNSCKAQVQDLACLLSAQRLSKCCNDPHTHGSPTVPHRHEPTLQSSGPGPSLSVVCFALVNSEQAKWMQRIGCFSDSLATLIPEPTVPSSFDLVANTKACMLYGPGCMLLGISGAELDSQSYAIELIYPLLKTLCSSTVCVVKLQGCMLHGPGRTLSGISGAELECQSHAMDTMSPPLKTPLQQHNLCLGGILSIA